ncbi:MAG: hypothetical protein V1929_01825, partial [bacterium]
MPMACFITMLLLVAGCACTSSHAATYYVDASAADDSGTGLPESPKKHIRSGITLMSGGDTLIVRDGLYTNDEDRIRGVPSGATGNYTTVMAEHDFGAVLSGLWSGTALASEQAPVNLYQKSWVSLEGFLIKDSGGSSIYALDAVCVNGSDHCRIRRMGIKNGVHAAAEYGGAVTVGSSSYCLIEDVFACGMMRYGVSYVGGPENHHNIMRRVLVRWDFCTTAQPRAGIVCYGNSQGSPPCHDILMQNCMVLDGNRGSGATFTGGFSAPHETSFLRRDGCISLNNEGYGFHSAEDSLCHDNVNTNCVVWDCDAGLWWRHLAGGTSGVYNSTLQGAGAAGSQDPGRGATYECEAVDNVLVAGASVSAMTESGSITQSVTNFQYLVRSPVATQGATIEQRKGVTGTLWGEAGYDDPTLENLWPWPNEDAIRELFREPNNPPVGVSPDVNDTRRGFCADGTTLTQYIWEYLGHSMPEDIYGISGPPVLFFSDLTSGPNTGGQDNQGAFVTVWGKNLGNTRRDSTITVGGGAVAGYPVWTNTKISFQLGTNAGTGNIELRTAEGVSSIGPFTVRTGAICFAATNGSDTTGNGSWTNPWRTIVKAKNMLAPGDIAYVEDGIVQDTMDSYNACVNLGSHGTEMNPKALIAYPGATVRVGTNSLGRAFHNWVTGGVGGYAGKHWVISQLHITSGSLGVPFAEGYRIVGNHFEAPMADGQTGIIEGRENHIKILGNTFYNVGLTNGTKLYHVIYVSGLRRSTPPRAPTEYD